LSPKHNDWYEELCALAAIGELSPSEFEDLQAHLAECGPCRAMQADFRRIAADDLGQVAVAKSQEETREEAGDAVDEHALLDRLLVRAREQRPSEAAAAVRAETNVAKASSPNIVRRALDWLRQPALSYGSVALLLCAVAGVGSYRLREAQLSPTLANLHSEVDDWKSRAQASTTDKDKTSELLRETKAERDALRKSIDEAETKYGKLENEEKSLEAQLDAAKNQLNQQTEEIASGKTTAAEKSKEISALEAQLRNATDRTEEQRRTAQNLQARLDRVEAQTAEAAARSPEAQGFGDAEAKQLFGARDLHIVDVYDVDAKGSTKRTYGRVYYVEKKLLMFYAFDLDKKRNRAPESFQAWGYRQPNEGKPESLGLFSVDDPSVNRWVLRVNNPRVLEHIDAVFVTAETLSGSPSPTGRRLLYANLAGPANHP
jgi:hypothetical protein